MTTEDTQGRQDEPQDDGQQQGSLPDRPQAHQEETVRALEEQQSGDEEPGQDEEQVAGDDVPDNPSSEEMEGLPGPDPDEPAEPAG